METKEATKEEMINYLDCNAGDSMQDYFWFNHRILYRDHLSSLDNESISSLYENARHFAGYFLDKQSDQQSDQQSK